MTTETQNELFFITPEHIKLLGDAQRANDSAKKATDRNNSAWDDVTELFVNTIGTEQPTLDDDGNETKDDDGNNVTHKAITASEFAFLKKPLGEERDNNYHMAVYNWSYELICVSILGQEVWDATNKGTDEVPADAVIRGPRGLGTKTKAEWQMEKGSRYKNACKKIQARTIGSPVKSDNKKMQEAFEKCAKLSKDGDIEYAENITTAAFDKALADLNKMIAKA
tara:strand:+ start:116 stop:787 length:672 start_codon:yes stop_codon:yes gene_type:complete